MTESTEQAMNTPTPSEKSDGEMVEVEIPVKEFRLAEARRQAQDNRHDALQWAIASYNSNAGMEGTDKIIERAKQFAQFLKEE